MSATFEERKTVWPTADEYRECANELHEAQVELSNFVHALAHVAVDELDAAEKGLYPFALWPDGKPTTIRAATARDLHRVVWLKMEVASDIAELRDTLRTIKRLEREIIYQFDMSEGGAS